MKFELRVNIKTIALWHNNGGKRLSALHISGKEIIGASSSKVIFKAPFLITVVVLCSCNIIVLQDEKKDDYINNVYLVQNVYIKWI